MPAPPLYHQLEGLSDPSNVSYDVDTIMCWEDDHVREALQF